MIIAISSNLNRPTSILKTKNVKADFHLFIQVMHTIIYNLFCDKKSICRLGYDYITEVLHCLPITLVFLAITTLINSSNIAMRRQRRYRRILSSHHHIRPHHRHTNIVYS